MKLPPLPKWNTITDDIDTGALFALAQAREQALLPSGITFPRTGQVWEAIRDCQVHFVASFAWAYKRALWLPGQHQPGSLLPRPSFGQARLPQGERVRVVELGGDPKPLVVWFEPLRYHELHEHIVPAEIRSAPRYSHYRLDLRTAPIPRLRDWLDRESEFFTEAFRLIEDAA